MPCATVPAGWVVKYLLGLLAGLLLFFVACGKQVLLFAEMPSGSYWYCVSLTAIPHYSIENTITDT